MIEDLAVIAVGLSWAALMAVAVPDFVQQIMRRENEHHPW